MTNYENLINLPLNFNANNHANNNENNAKIAVAEQLLNKMSQRDFSEVSLGIRKQMGMGMGMEMGISIVIIIIIVMENVKWT